MNLWSNRAASHDNRSRRAPYGLLLILLAGCLDTASNYHATLPSLSEDDSSSSKGDDDDAKDDDGDAKGDGDDDGKGDGDDDSSSGDGDDDSSNGDGDDQESDGGKPPVMMSLIKGTAKEAGCSSYQAQDGDDQCAGYYCGVSKDMIEAELKGGGKCDPTPEDVCSGKVTTRVAKCARDTKSNPLNALDSDEMIRAKTLKCVQMDTSIEASDECLGCFLDAAQCASKNCLTQCLTGDSATCDTCRMKNNCNQQVPTCAGLPSPF